MRKNYVGNLSYGTERPSLMLQRSMGLRSYVPTEDKEYVYPTYVSIVDVYLDGDCEVTECRTGFVSNEDYPKA